MTHYDNYANWYDLFSWAELKARQAGLNALNCSPGETVLEIGCGTGTCLTDLVQASGIGGKVIGLDLSPGMLAVAKQRLVKSTPVSDIYLICADAQQLPLADHCRDAIFTSFTLELFETPSRSIVLNECKRVLSSQGRLCAVCLSATRPSLMTRLYQRIHQFFPNIIDCAPIMARQSLTQAGFMPIFTEILPFWGMAIEVILARPANRLLDEHPLSGNP